MSGTWKRLYGPAYMSGSVANIFNLSSALIYTIIRRIHIVNTTGSDSTATLYIGGTGGSTAGTEYLKSKLVSANDEFNEYCYLVLKSTDFLTGLAGAANALTITLEGEQLVIP